MTSPQIDEIKQKLDIAEIVRQKVPDLKKAGRNYKGLCPFHQEKTPSFMVNPDLGIFKCFGCGEGGDVISFIEKTERLDFREALKMAAEMAGVKINDEQFKRDEAKEQEITNLKTLNLLAAKYFHYLLKEHKVGESALAYARKRGMTDEMLEKFMIGYDPNGSNLCKFLQSKGYSAKSLIDNGFAVTRNGQLIDKFRERLIFPIYNLKGDIIGFSGRILKKDVQPKFLNSPETLIYKKSESLYGFYQGKEEIRKKNSVILFEGNVDIINSHRLNVQNVACPLGTALTKEQLKVCKRYAETVYFCFDTDEAGYKALLRGIGLAEELGMKHKAIDIGKYLDADELMMAEPDAWSKSIEEASNSIEHILKLLHKKYDLSVADDKITFKDEIVDVLNLLKDEVELAHFVNKIASLLGVTRDVIMSQLKNRRGLQRSYEKAEEKEQPEVRPSMKISKRELLLLALLSQLESPEVIKKVLPDIFVSEHSREIFSKFVQYKNKMLDLGKIAGEIDVTSRPLLEKVIMYDVPAVKDVEEEILKIYRQMYIARLRKEIKELGLKLKNFPDDEQAISELNYLTKELHHLVSNKKEWPIENVSEE